jgi:hypothetical protein
VLIPLRKMATEPEKKNLTSTGKQRVNLCSGEFYALVYNETTKRHTRLEC